MDKAKLLHDRRTARVRHSLRRKSGGRVRLSIFRSSKHIYAQIIDDTQGVTIAAASSVEKELKGALTKGGGDLGAAKAVGLLVAKRAIAAGIKEVAFDRGGYRYHGRVRALADAAREGGLSF